MIGLTIEEIFDVHSIRLGWNSVALDIKPNYDREIAESLAYEVGRSIAIDIKSQGIEIFPLEKGSDIKRYNDKDRIAKLYNEHILWWNY